MRTVELVLIDDEFEYDSPHTWKYKLGCTVEGKIVIVVPAINPADLDGTSCHNENDYGKYFYKVIWIGG